MLYNLFPRILSMSLTAGAVIIFVLLARLALRRAPKVFSYALWAVVLFRLLCPTAIELSVSALPARLDGEEIVARWADDYVGDTKTMFSAAEGYDRAVAGGAQPVQSHEGGGSYVITADDGVSPPPTVHNTWLPVLSVIWLAGAAALLIYSVISLLLLRRRLVGAALLRENTYIADHIDSPFVLGLLKPKIYLPSALGESEREYILLHEGYHIRRLDHVAKLLFFAALCVHWFNPLVWLAFSLAVKDMEMSCDEAVLGKMGGEIRADYSASLLTLATGRRIIAGTPLAFGEGDPKSRIKNVLSWKKPTVWIIIGAAVLCVVVVVLCAVNPKAADKKEPDPGETELAAGETYVSESCIFMNPLSSFFPVDGDSGYKYVLGGESFAFVNRQTGEETRISPVDWGWRDFPWTKEQWNELLVGDEETGRVSLDTYEELLYQPLNDKYCLIQADGQLWLVEMHDITNMGRMVWSIFTLVREPEKLEYRPEAVSFRPEDIHNLVSAELYMRYGSYPLTDAESLAWLEENLGTATELTGTPTCSFEIALYLTRADGTVGVINLAEDSCDVFKSGDSFFDWRGGDNTALRELFGTQTDYVEKEYNDKGLVVKESVYSWNRLREICEYEYGANNEQLKMISYNGNRTFTTESEYENGLMIKQTQYVDGQTYSTIGQEYDEDGDITKLVYTELAGKVSQIEEYKYDVFTAKSCAAKRPPEI